MNLEPKISRERMRKKDRAGRKRKMEKKLIGRKKLLQLRGGRESQEIKQVPVDLKSYWASRKSDCTILQTIQSGGWLFAMRNYDHKRQFCYRF